MFTREEPERTIRLISPIIPTIVIILLAIQLFFPFKGWVILFSGFGGMWIVSYIWARSLKQGLRINRDMRFGWKQVGDRLRERILLENNSWAPCLWIQIDDHSDIQDYEISSITDVRGWRYRNWHTQGVCSHRGLFTLGPVTLETEDPFGIYKVKVDYSESVNMMVVPPVVTLPEIEIASGGRVGEGRTSNKGLKQTVSTVGIREYVPGDSLRWLHWPTIARMGKMYVHTFDNEPSSDWWVLLDMDERVQVGEGQRSTEEHGVMLAASLINRGIEMGKHVGLITHGDDLVWHTPDLGDAHLWSTLRSLATIRTGGPPLSKILTRIRSSLGRNSSLIVITPNLNPSWISSLEMLKRLGIIPTVLFLDPLSFGGEGNLEGIQSRLRKLDVTYHTITSDLLDRPQKPGKKEWEWLTSTRPRGEILDDWDVFWGKTRRWLRNWGLVFLFYFFFASMLDGAIRGLEIDLIWYMIAAGMVVGGGLAYTKMRGWISGVLFTLTGLTISILRVGNLGAKVLDAIVRIIQLIPGTFSWAFRSGDQPDFEPLLIRMDEIWVGGSALGARLWEWGINLFKGQSYFDPVTITFMWSGIIWGLVVWSIWALIRKNKPLVGFIPPIALVGITMAFVRKDVYDIVFMLGVTITLMALVHHDLRERHWLASKMTFTSGIRKNMMAASIGLTLGLMIFALITPSISIDSITDFVRNLSGQGTAEDSSIARTLGLENQSGDLEVDKLDTVRVGGLPNQHLIGSGSELSEQVVMVVGVESPHEDALQTPLYLRSLVYDKYTGRGWESRSTEIVAYSAGEKLLEEKPINAYPVRQNVQFIEDLGGFMYTVGDPNSVDHDFKVAWRVRDFQVGIFDTLGSTIETDSYRADSYVRVQSSEELRSAGQGYPEWVRDRYMDLPAVVPESVLALAVELTATEVTPFDRAVALEQYLRRIPYSLEVSRGPAGADIVEYFLFQLQKGYCDYYASAMVVLARAAGIPARYVIGYIGEHFDESEGVYIITADQAHSWVEVYFPGYGWVPFEPTGGRPAMDRPIEPIPELPDEFEFDFSPLVPEKGVSFDLWLPILGSVITAILVLAWIRMRISDWWLERLDLDRLIPRLYKRIYLNARWAGLQINPGDTAFHFADSLITYLTQLGGGCHWSEWILDGIDRIQELTLIFVQCTFGSLKVEDEPVDVLLIYKQLRIRLWLLILLGKAYPYRILRPFLWENTSLYNPIPLEEEL
jgi:transglutaminase-like putative cysteine protease/uncharacterized protein (DUF58 family)